MAAVERKSLDEPDGGLVFAHGAGSYVRVRELSVGRARLEPGWRWSVDVKPLAGTNWCEIHHFHVVLAGRMAVQLRDGGLAEFVAGDVCDIPPGHDAWVVGDETLDLLDVSGNVEAFGVPASNVATVTTLLMTDIVDSTATAERLGHPAWNQVLERHNRIIRAQLARFGGTEIDTTGDGFLATFPSASSALACARSIRDCVPATGLHVRIGVHTGEVEFSSGDVRGVAVHAAARVAAVAGPSEIVMTSVTRSLAANHALALRPLGAHSLKGIADPLELFAVE